MKQHNTDSLWKEFRKLTRLWPYLKNDKRLIIISASLVPIVSVLQASMPLIIQRTVDQGLLTRSTDAVLYGTIAFLCATILAWAARGGQSILSAIAVHRMGKNLRDTVVNHILSLSCSFHDRTLSGTLVTRATSDFDNLNESLNQGVLTSLVDIAVLVGCLSGLFILDWRLATIALLILPVASGVVNWCSRGIKKSMLESRVKIASLNAFTQECLYGGATVKLLGAHKDAQKKFDKLNIEYRDVQMASVVLDAFMFSIIDGMAAVAIGVVLWLCSGHVLGPEELTAGMMVAFITYLQQLFEPLKQLGNKIAMLQGAFTSIDRIFGVLSENSFVTGDRPAGNIAGDIEFRNVSFSYDVPTDKKGIVSKSVLKNFSLSVPRGTSLAIVGQTGSGKSTLVKLLTKLYDGYDGHITIDGNDLKVFEPSLLRHTLVMVPQDIVLFEGDFLFNIGLGIPEVSESAIIEAAKAVGADDFIRQYPEGYKTKIREQGSNLSHGQRQLIAFARALARNPAVVVLDEATSSVDPQSEATIQRAIERILQGRTVIVIAHRLSTIERCDKIAVLHNGELAEQGKHQELLDMRGKYFSLQNATAR
jgi:ATP-binding cassette subfamily B multidrug efflux pump